MPFATLTLATLFQQFQDRFGLRWIAGEPEAGTTLLHEPRQGEPCIAGVLDLIRPHPIQVIGQTEARYLENLGKNSFHDSLQALCKDGCRAVILCEGTDLPVELAELARKRHIALLSSPSNAREVVEAFNHHLRHSTSAQTILHGVFLEVLGSGVLLTGASGIGKSELALELISRGHRLIADDAPEFIRQNGEIIGHCPPLLQDFLEVRGLGLLNIRSMFGDDAILEQKLLQLIIQLTPMEAEEMLDLDRLRGSRHIRTILGADVPELKLPVAAGRNLAVLVEAASRCQILYNKGYSAFEDFVTRQQRMMTDTE